MDNTRKILRSMMEDEALEALKAGEKTRLALVHVGL